ncbi:MAG: hypothetical protein AB7V42_06205 [Thermoleophilia bacterium]
MLRSPPSPPAVLAAAVVAVAGLWWTATAGASQIVYQCGAGVCAVDPDGADAPVTLTAAGRVAGVTSDGRTAAWVTPDSSLVERPLAPGGLDATLFSGEIYDFPRISPSGAQALWSFYLGGYGWYTYLAPGSGGGYPPAIASSTYQTTHGWLGTTPLVAVHGGGTAPSQLCAVVAGGPVCDTPLASEPDVATQIAFPSGRPGGDEIVAIRGAAPSSFGVPVTGRIALYSTATHTRVRDVTTVGTDAHPALSAEGDRVAFERSGEIYVASTTGADLRRVATGTMPFWGGPRTLPSGPGAPGPAPGPTPAPGPDAAPGRPAVASSSLRYRSGRIAVAIRCTGASACAGTLRLRRGAVTLGARAYRIARGGRATIAVRPTARGRRIISRSRTLRVVVRLTPRVGAPVAKRVTLRR